MLFFFKYIYIYFMEKLGELDWMPRETQHVLAPRGCDGYALEPGWGLEHPETLGIHMDLQRSSEKSVRRITEKSDVTDDWLIFILFLTCIRFLAPQIPDTPVTSMSRSEVRLQQLLQRLGDRWSAQPIPAPGPRCPDGHPGRRWRLRHLPVCLAMTSWNMNIMKQHAQPQGVASSGRVPKTEEAICKRMEKGRGRVFFSKGCWKNHAWPLGNEALMISWSHAQKCRSFHGRIWGRNRRVHV